MADSLFPDNEFLRKLEGIIEDNLSDENFGVSELAAEADMSRSNLLRKVRKLSDLSVSRFIRKIRLHHSRELLTQTSLNVSEVAFKVGFSSTSYFIKCFKEEYGHPPGETGKQEAQPKKEFRDSFGRTHQLAAIMFTDIEGYTALMQKDEAKGVAFRNRHREIFNAAIEKFKGKILQYYGDGTLSTFQSANDAVRCGIEMQLAYRQEPQIPVRIGIHTGDIIFTEDDIIGDGVNVASRIESLAVSGSICISDKVFDEIKNQPGIYTVSMGTFELKNIGKPTEVYAIANQGLVVPEKQDMLKKAKLKSKPVDESIFVLKKKRAVPVIISIVALIVLFYFVFIADIFNLQTKMARGYQPLERQNSIAVLPFINDSDDSTNIYLINGLMESTLNNLQKINDLRVVSRTSVEKYRLERKTIPEIAEELNVKYLVEGSGQKAGEQIRLNIQLIDASSDKHLWSEQYQRELTDIFQLQSEVAKNIASKIKVIITPEEHKRIEKPPTDNVLAYDYFLKGMEHFRQPIKESMYPAINFFQMAIKEDSLFARAHANIAIAYYYLDIYQTEKQYTDSINLYADKALLLDGKLTQSLMAKGLFYINSGNRSLAVPYLEKALEYNPNSADVINLLSDFYSNWMPDSRKYLEYALKGLQLNPGPGDSVRTSITYLHLSNAFIQSGFVNQAFYYVNRSLDFDPNNLYSIYLKAYIEYVQNPNLKQLVKKLKDALKQDSSRLDIVQEIGKVYYYLRDYESSYKYYQPFVEAREKYNLNIYPGEDSKIAMLYRKLGMEDEAQQMIENYKQWTLTDKSVYKHLSQAVYHAFQNNEKKAIENLQLFAQQEGYHYWVILFLEMDPLMEDLKDNKDFKKIMKEIKQSFDTRKNKLEKTLRKQNLI